MVMGNSFRKPHKLEMLYGDGQQLEKTHKVETSYGDRQV